MINGKNAERLIYGAYALLGLIIICITILSAVGREIPSDLKQMITYLAVFLFASQGIKPGIPASAIEEHLSKLGIMPAVGGAKADE